MYNNGDAFKIFSLQIRKDPWKHPNSYFFYETDILMICKSRKKINKKTYRYKFFIYSHNSFNYRTIYIKHTILIKLINSKTIELATDASVAKILLLGKV